ncbi:hypothetical protein K7640_20695 [Micromonospora sp. PLK6-60]|uniref:hypothetical protein n=1 Tax=Micromonospora sp. PLK6-60 TaxID=2873383 RepID=UPI001CA76DA2|nr:hypothetical protein [Micromonospora sp. PLK6-60]MBY8874252.1 hypothetical protein [Micromonospora sp. PLK6-60]
MADAAGPAGPAGPSRFERVVLGWVRGDGETALTAGLWLAFTALLTSAFLFVLGWEVRDGLALENRGRLAEARVVRVNEGRGVTANIVFVSGPTGTEALMEDPAGPPEPGEVILVRYDPRDPGVVRDAAAPIWRWPLLLIGAVISASGSVVVAAEWLRFARRLRERRWRRGPGAGRHPGGSR